MGYSGLSIYGESDTAADSMFVVVQAMMKALKSEHKSNKNTGPHNTNGDVNTCLLIESGLFDFDGAEDFLDDHLDFFKNVEASMEKQINDAPQTGLSDVESYKRMLKHLRILIKKIETA